MLLLSLSLGLLGVVLAIQSHIRTRKMRLTEAEVLIGTKNVKDNESEIPVALLRYTDENGIDHCVMRVGISLHVGTKIPILHHREKPEISLHTTIIERYGAAMIAFTLSFGALISN